MNTTLRNLIGFTLLAAIVLAMACQCWATVTQDGNGWTVVAYPPSGGGEMWFCDQDGGNDANDGRDPNGFDLSTATYTHSTRTLTSSGAFSGYTHTGGDRTDVIYITGATGGVATGYYIIDSKTSNDAIVLEAASGLTADATGVSSSDGPEKTVAAVIAHATDGADDQILFQCGDTWTDEAIHSTLSENGLSADEPLLISSYGSGARPKFLTEAGKNFYRKITSGSYIAIIGLEGTPTSRALTTSDSGIILNAIGASFILEDCKLEGYATNSLNAPNGSIYDGMTIRRNIIINNYASNQHSQGFFFTRVDGLLLEENIFDHNGWQIDWEDYAVLASGTTAAYTNGDTLTVTCVRYGAFTASDEGNNLDIELIDTNDASGTVDSIVYTSYSGFRGLQISLDLTTGVASNTVAAAIQAYNSGADFTCTSSGTANLVVADVGTQLDVTSGGISAHPTIFNHSVYLSEGATNVTIRGNVSSRAANHCIKGDIINEDLIVSDNLFVRCGAGGQWGMGAYDVDFATNGINLEMYNNVWVEGEAIANNNSLGPTIMSVASGYMRNNILCNRYPPGTYGGSWQFLVQDHVDGVGINNLTFDNNVFYNLRGPFEFNDPKGYEDGDPEDNPQGDFNTPTVSNNVFSNNTVVLPTGQTDDPPLMETQWADSGEMIYSGNTYYSPNSTANEWFKVHGVAISTTTWQSTYDATATLTEPSFTAPTRTTATFAVAEGYADWDAWMADLQAQRKGDWDESIMAAAVNDYIRAGFDMSEYNPSPDTTAPEFVSAELTGTNVITVYFNEVVTSTDETGFSLSASGGAATLTMTDFSGASLAFTASRTIYDNEVLTLSYDSGTGDVADSSSNALGDLTSESVTNSGSESQGITYQTFIPGVLIQQSP